MGRPPAADLLGVAEEAAEAAVRLLLPRFGSERPSGAKSSPTDLVSEADLGAERAIREVLARRRPDDGILGEEGTGDVAGTTGLRWVVDPLDGTVNYLYGIPQWCVSVAVEDAEGRELAGVVLDPVREERFAATADGPATLDGRELAPEREDRLERALIATGFGYRSDVRESQAAVVARLLPRVRDVRRAGSAALDLAWAAAGRLDGYYERGVKPWDVAAGTLIARRAGLEVRELAPSPPADRGLVAAPAALVEPLLELVA